MKTTNLNLTQLAELACERAENITILWEKEKKLVTTQ